MIRSLNEYQVLAERTFNDELSYDEALKMCTVGIASEAGEVAEDIKHHYYHGHPLDQDNLIKELGDIMWYVATMAHVLGVPLSDVAERNIRKLAARYPEKFNSADSFNRDTSRE